MGQIDYEDLARDDLLETLSVYAEQLPGFDLVLEEKFDICLNELPQISFCRLMQIAEHFEQILV